MSGSNGDTYQIPSGLSRIQVDGGVLIEVDLIEAHLKQNEIIDQSKDKPEYWWLEQLRAWLGDKGVTLSDARLGILDGIWQALVIQYNLAKKKQSEELDSTVKSLSSTAA